MSELIRGGLSSGMKPSDFPAAALRKGIRVELEHVVRPGKKPTKRDIRIATEITMDHLVEDEHYYDYLEEMERKMAKKKASPVLKLVYSVDFLCKPAATRRRHVLAVARQRGRERTYKQLSSQLQRFDRAGMFDARKKVIADWQWLQKQPHNVTYVSPKGKRIKKNLAPSKKKGIYKAAVKHPHRLSNLAAELGQPSKPFMKRSFAEQKKVIDLCVRKYGYRSCLGSTLLLRNFPAIRRDAKMRARATALKDYAVRTYGGPGSFKRNPKKRGAKNGTWQAIPIIVAHAEFDGKCKLSGQQFELLMREAA